MTRPCRLLRTSQAEPGECNPWLVLQVNWEQEQSHTSVHIPEHAMEEGRSRASANGTSGSGMPLQRVVHPSQWPQIM